MSLIVSPSPHLFWFAAGIHGDKEDFQDPPGANRQWDAEVAEGVEGHRNIAAIRTHQCGLEKAMESVHDHRIISSFVVLPGFLSHFLLTSVTVAYGQRERFGDGFIVLEAKDPVEA